MNTVQAPKYVKDAINARLKLGTETSKTIPGPNAQKWLTENMGICTDSPICHVNGTAIQFYWNVQAWAVVPT